MADTYFADYCWALAAFRCHRWSMVWHRRCVAATYFARIFDFWYFVHTICDRMWRLFDFCNRSCSRDEIWSTWGTDNMCRVFARRHSRVAEVSVVRDTRATHILNSHWCICSWDTVRQWERTNRLQIYCRCGHTLQLKHQHEKEEEEEENKIKRKKKWIWKTKIQKERFKVFSAISFLFFFFTWKVEWAKNSRASHRKSCSGPDSHSRWLSYTF